ncbi:MAG TPA: hypothetical protein VGE52_16180 [Pirellulales bacterium]
MKMNFLRRSVWTRLGGAALIATLAFSAAEARDHHVPGTGQIVAKVGDDFEDAEWKYNYNLPKASVFNDKAARHPGGGSVNGRLVEAMYRGQPDVIKRVETPEGGLEGSKGSLLIRTLNSGIPGAPSMKQEQDDLLVPFRSRIGRSVPMSCNPSVVVRVFFAPFEKWEQHTGSSFAFRADCRSLSTKAPGMMEEFWPGLFVQFEASRDRGGAGPKAYWIIRCDESGRDFRGPDITTLGWWTLGMSFTADGRVHYYASPGVDDLTEKDFIASHVPYGFRSTQLEMFFFNCCSVDSGRSWSTPWIIDDARLYVKTMPTASMHEYNLPVRDPHKDDEKSKPSQPRRRLFGR